MSYIAWKYRADTILASHTSTMHGEWIIEFLSPVHPGRWVSFDQKSPARVGVIWDVAAELDYDRAVYVLRFIQQWAGKRSHARRRLLNEDTGDFIPAEILG